MQTKILPACQRRPEAVVYNGATMLAVRRDVVGEWVMVNEWEAAREVRAVMPVGMQVWM